MKSFGASAPNGVIVERNVPVKMRDGVVLRADIYRPEAKGKYPVILERTPYNKMGYGADFGLLRAAERGYGFIIQDVRGRYESEGEWYPFKHEADDGYDTVEWAAALPYSNGKVGMYGASYVGATQMLAAIAAPPHLTAIFPQITASNYHDNWVYQSGALEQWFDQSWTSGLSHQTAQREIRKHSDVLSWVKKLPLADYPLLPAGASWELAPYFNDWLRHPEYDDYWKQWSIEEFYSKIKVPAYYVGAWYDIFLGGTLRNYQGIKTQGGSEAARRGQRLLIMIGGHSGGGRKIGQVDFGPEANLDLDDLVLRWYDYVLKGIDNGIEKEKPVKYFVMGSNTWREADEWPPARNRPARFYLHSEGQANSLRGSGTLSQTVPSAEIPDHFVYDPADPVPTIGGPLCCGGQLGRGPQDQRPAEARDDVLVYSTSPFKQDFEVTGPVSAELYVSSSAVDTDFTAKLVDVWPNGFAQNLTEGILRARYRDSQEKPEFLNPGQVYKITLDLWATSTVFRAGHRLRAEISSSNFPRFDRNLNTGESPERGSRTVAATNMIFHDHGHPSALILTVRPQLP